MLALAGIPLGVHVRFLDPAANGPAARLGPQIAAHYHDPAGLAQFVAGLDCVTYEFENVPTATADLIAVHVPVLPPPVALAAAQDRLIEKRFFHSLNIPTAPFAQVDQREDLESALGAIGFPALLKTRQLGYDGKGQMVIQSPEDVEPAWVALAGSGGGLILEGFVAFARELSIIAVRGKDGVTACYPLIENTHRAGILRRSIAPAVGVDSELQALAESYVQRALDALGYVGVLAIELFEIESRRMSDGAYANVPTSRPRLIVNEMAPRVHNSGHWTIEGAETSQFENHLRAVAGLPLGSTAMRGYAGMVNLIGTMPPSVALLAIPGTHLHLYEKSPRPGRKLGHVTVRADDRTSLLTQIALVEAQVALADQADEATTL
jgi:5-(carboxyamino)imidazole ribonucleotide synthase